MTAEERKQFFAQKLNEQRHLLRAAITAMGVGDLTQALHVATIIRTLVHETGASKPLLKHLHANYLELPILDRDHGAAEGPRRWRKIHNLHLSREQLRSPLRELSALSRKHTVQNMFNPHLVSGGSATRAWFFRH